MEILKLIIHLTNTYEVAGEKGTVRMLSFTGECKSNFFHGEILPGGVDTQVLRPDGTISLSARYIMRGTDDKGESCSIFIENNATARDGDAIQTTPTVYTDSVSLKWLEKASLKGRILTENEALIICIETIE